MQINLNKLSQLVLTMLGLASLALAAMLNHLHPHNQGIADINQRSIYQRLGITSASSDGFARLSYAKTLPAAATKPKDKIADPTEQSPDNNAALPQAPMAGDQDVSQNSSTTTVSSDASQDSGTRAQPGDRRSKYQDSTKS